MRIHLRSCAECRSDVVAFTYLRSEIEQFGDFPAPSGLRDRVLADAALARIDHSSTARLPNIGRFFSMRRALFATVFGIIVIVLGGIVLYPVFSTTRKQANMLPSATIYDAMHGATAGTPMATGGATAAGGMTPMAGAVPVSGGPGMPGAASPASPGEAVSPQVPWSVAEASGAHRMVITTATVTLEVGDVDKAMQQIRNLCRDAGGYVTASDLSNDDGRRGGTVTIRIPGVKYQSALASVTGLGKVISNKETGDDVTEEYVDLDSRLRNLRHEEEAFLNVLGNAHRVVDILAVESEISRVRGEIEETTGRMKFLNNQASLSTICITLQEPSPVVANVVGWDIGQTATGAFNALKAALRGITSAVIWFVILIVPLSVLVLLVIYVVRKVIKRLNVQPTEPTQGG
jgi:hypothetical protein